MTDLEKVMILIASFFEEEHVRLISIVDSRMTVIYKLDLLRSPRPEAYTSNP